MQNFILALRFLTIIPVFPQAKSKEEAMGKSVISFPLVGFLLGCFLVLINHFLNYFLAQKIVDLFIIISLVFLTGGLHIDGFVDTFDALFSQKKGKEFLQIMQDTKVGTGGIVSCFLLLFLKYTLLESLKIKGEILILMTTLSRFSLVYLICFFPYAKEEGKGKVYFQYANKKNFLKAALFALPISFLLFSLKGIIILIAVLIFSNFFAKYFKNKIGGITGDILGANNELMELLVLLISIMTI